MLKRVELYGERGGFKSRIFSNSQSASRDLIIKLEIF